MIRIEVHHKTIHRSAQSPNRRCASERPFKSRSIGFRRIRRLEESQIYATPSAKI